MIEVRQTDKRTLRLAGLLGLEAALVKYYIKYTQLYNIIYIYIIYKILYDIISFKYTIIYQH